MTRYRSDVWIMIIETPQSNALYPDSEWILQILHALSKQPVRGAILTGQGPVVSVGGIDIDIVKNMLMEHKAGRNNIPCRTFWMRPPWTIHCATASSWFADGTMRPHCWKQRTRPPHISATFSCPQPPHIFTPVPLKQG